MADHHENYVEVQTVDGWDVETVRLAHTHRAEDYVRAITNAKGIISVAARELGVSRSAVYLMAEKYPLVRQALDDAREAMVDLAEVQLFKKVSDGDTSAVFFALKTLGRKRGYVERQERHHTGNINLNLQELSDEELMKIARGIPAGDTGAG